jgi:hypothetical protein
LPFLDTLSLFSLNTFFPSFQGPFLQQGPLHLHLRLLLFLLILGRSLPNHQHQLFLPCLGERRRGLCGERRLDCLVFLAKKVVIEEIGSVFAASFVPDIHRESEFEVKRTHLANVFILAAGLADAGSLEDAFVALPLEDGEGPEADPALLSEVLLEHAHEGVFAVAAVAGEGEVGALPALLVDAALGRQSSLSLHSLILL